MTNEEIIVQFRKLRAVKREQLSKQLYTKYIGEKSIVLENINKQIDEAEYEHNEASHKYACIILGIGEDAAKRKRRETDVKYQRLLQQRDTLICKYESECEYCTKQREFDIETENIILAHMCDVQSICGNKKVLPMLDVPDII